MDGVPMGQVTENELFKVEKPKPINDADFQVITETKEP